MSEFLDIDEENVAEFLTEALKESVDFYEHDDYAVDWDDSGVISAVEYGDNGYGGRVSINTYDIEIKVKRRERITD